MNFLIMVYFKNIHRKIKLLEQFPPGRPSSKPREPERQFGPDPYNRRS